MNGDSDLPVCMDVHGDNWDVLNNWESMTEEEDREDKQPSDDNACTSIIATRKQY